MGNRKSDNKIKITHFARFASPHIGGIEAVINQINNSLSNVDYEKEVYCCSNKHKSSFENGVKFIRCRYLFNFAANSISPQLFFRMMFLKTDVIHFHMPVIQNVIIWFILYHLGLLRYKKMIITYHGAIIGYDKYMKPFWSLYRYFYKKADKIHVLSPTIITTDEVLSNNKEKCTVIPYGIDTDIEEKCDNNILINGYDIKKFANGKKILLCMGRLVEWKGFLVAIKAMKNINDAVLLVAGNGDEFENYSNYIKENNLSDKVLLLGNVIDKKQKDYLLSNIDIFILPSVKKSESFGIVQLEAMKYSKPVINTNLGTGVNYVSVGGETGLTVEPNDIQGLSEAINKLVQDRLLYEKFSINARKRVEELFDIEKNSYKYTDLYK